MLEYGEYKGHLYGTSVNAVRAVLAEGKICVMDLEPQVGLCRIFSITLKAQMRVIRVVGMSQAVTETFYSDRFLRVRPTLASQGLVVPRNVNWQPFAFSWRGSLISHTQNPDLSGQPLRKQSQSFLL